MPRLPSLVLRPVACAALRFLFSSVGSSLDAQADAIEAHIKAVCPGLEDAGVRGAYLFTLCL